MIRTLSSLLLVLLVGAAIAPSPAQAQTKRADDTFYLKFGAGFSDYTGDFADVFQRFDDPDGFPYSWVGEVGYQTSPSFSVGLAYQAGQYPRVNDGAPETNPHRFSGQLLGRYTIGARDWSVAPYIDGGVNLSFTGTDTGPDVGGGPALGLGFDILLSDWASLYVESRTNLTFGDAAMDGADTGPVSSPSFDALSHVGAGFKLNFKRATTPPRILSVDGPTDATTGESLTYTATINRGEATRPLTFQWDFGDGAMGSGTTASHAYREAGTYEITFTASNRAGEASETVTVDVVQPARIVSIGADPNPVDEGEAVSFSSNVQGSSPISYAWDFGDGNTGEGASPSHTYEEPGTYTVELAASNEAGESSQTLTVTVERSLPSICTTIEDFNSAFFEGNSSTLTDSARSSLQENLDILSRCPNLDVSIDGFAAPGERSPQALSSDRADAVASFYEEGGISPDRITAEGQGVPEGATVGKKGDAQQYRRADSNPEQ